MSESKLTSTLDSNPYPTVPEGKSLLMDPRTAVALRQSIEHWEELADEPRVSGSYGCALCRLFHPLVGDVAVATGLSCAKCPIYAVTGEPGCHETPYARFSLSLGSHTEASNVALAELSFLTHLLSRALIRDYAPTAAKLIDTPPEPASWPTPPALDLISKISSGPNPPTCWPPVIKPGLYLHLYHGRRTLDEDMDDWGFDGPHIGPIVGGVSMTYGSEINIILEPEDYRKFFGDLPPNFGRLPDEVHHSLIIKNGCVEYSGMYYGDFTVYVQEGAPCI